MRGGTCGISGLNSALTPRLTRVTALCEKHIKVTFVDATDAEVVISVHDTVDTVQVYGTGEHHDKTLLEGVKVHLKY